MVIYKDIYSIIYIILNKTKMEYYNLSDSDIQNTLSDIKDSISENKDIIDTNNKNNIKQCRLKKNISQLESFMDSKVINLYQRAWTKLELKFKTKKIEEYYRNQVKENKIKETDYDESIKVSLKKLKEKKLKVKYDDINCVILSLSY